MQVQASESKPIGCCGNRGRGRETKQTLIMNEIEYENDSEKRTGGLNVNDIMFMLFRHKRIVIFFSILGIGAAAWVYFIMPPVYESEAKLLVRYVIERSAIDAMDGQVRMAADNLINSEVEILTSRDLAAQVAEAVSAKRVGPGGVVPPATAEEVRGIQQSVTVTPLKGSNIIRISFKNEDPEVARRLLDELVQLYLSKHLEVHRSLGAFEFVTGQSNQIRSRLSKTEEQLKKLKAEEGIISVAETSTALSAELARTQDELRAAEAGLAEQQARVKEMEKWFAGAPETPEMPSLPSRDVVQQYQVLVTRLGKLRQAEFDVLSKYTPESGMATRVREQIEGVEAQRRSLEKKHPSLATTVQATTGTTNAAPDQGPDLIGARATLASFDAKAAWLKSRLEVLRNSIHRFAEVAPQIEELERKRALDEENYKYHEASLEKARIDEALDPSKIPNISVVQKPSSAIRTVSTQKKKIVLGLAGGGIAFGMAIALLMELIVDRSVKRPLEFESQLRIPMLCWIPFVGRRQPQLRNSRAEKAGRRLALAESSSIDVPPWDPGHYLRSFAEEMRDRLLLYFEITKTTHKPKLVAVTSCSRGAGTSTIAGGLAAALSETGEGKVLLVDMRDTTECVHPFFDGCPITSMSDALDSKTAMCAAAENLYLAIAALPENGGASIAPKTFYNMVPRFQTSDFDYVIFDMPPMDESTSTLAIARFMDKVLLVVESEKSGRDTVLRSYSDLKRANVNVSAVLNKTRSYTPKWLGYDS